MSKTMPNIQDYTFDNSDYGLSNSAGQSFLQANPQYTNALRPNQSIDSSLSTTGNDWSLSGTLGNVGKFAGGLASLGQIYVGLKALGIAEDELGIKKEQWGMAKNELLHMQNVRRKLSASYMGRPAPGPTVNNANPQGGPTKQNASRINKAY